jgi:hypothetical protein
VKLQRKWQRAWEHSQQSSQPCQSSRSKLKRILAMVATFGIMIQPTSVLGSAIIGGGQFAPDIQQNSDGTVYNIYSNHYSGYNAFNSFDRFDLSQNHIANIHFTRPGLGDASSVFNFVNDTIRIGGTVNALRNSNEIGGQVYFLSKSGMVVSSTGVINAGGLHVMTPNAATMNQVFNGGNLDLTQFQTDIANDAIPINPTGTIIVRGQINASSDVRLTANTIQIGNYYLSSEVPNSDDAKIAKITTGVTEFSSLVNTSEANAGLDLAVASKSGNGDIVLKAVSHNVVDTDTGEIAASHAVIEVGQNAVLDTSTFGDSNGGDIHIIAEASQTYSEAANKDLTKYKGNLLPELGSLDLDVVDLDFSSSATIRIDGTITARKNINVLATSTIDAKSGGMGELVSVNLANDSEVTIGGTLESKELGSSIDINAKTNTNLVANAAAKTNIDGDISVALLMVDGSSNANVHLKDGSSVTIDNGRANNTIKIGSSVVNNLETSAKSSAEPDGSNTPLGAVSINITNFTSQAETKINGNVSGNADISLIAHNEMLNNKVMANNSAELGAKKPQTGNSFDSQKLNTLTDIIGGIAGTGTERTDSTGNKTSEVKDVTEGSDGSSNPILGGGGAVTIVDEQLSAKVVIGDTADASINSTTGNVNISAEMLGGDINMQANSDSKANGSTNSLSAGVLVANINNDSVVKIGGANGAANISGNAVNIDSAVKVEYQRVIKLIASVNTILDGLESLGSLDLTEIKSAIDNLGNMENLEEDGFFGEENFAKIQELALQLSTLGEALKGTASDNPEIMAAISEFKTLYEYNTISNLANFTARSSAAGSADADLAGAGAVSFSSVTNNSKVEIGPNSQITARTGNLDIASVNVNEAVNFGGNMNNKLLGGLISSNPILKSEAGVTLGGTYTQQNFKNSAGVYIAEGVELSGKDINISSDTDLFNVAATIGAGKSSGDVAFMGMASVSRGTSENVVSIDDGVRINASGKLNIAATNTTNVTNVAGSFAMTDDGGAAVGVALALNDFEVINKALIGDNNDYFNLNSSSMAGKISASDVSLSAKTDGIINAVSIAGGVSKSSGNNDGESNNNEEKEPGFLDKLKGYADKISEVKKVTDGNLESVADYFNQSEDSGSSKVGEKMDSGATEQKDGKINGTGVSGNGATGAGGEDQKIEANISGAGSVSINLIDTETVTSIQNVEIELTGDTRSLNAVATDDAWIGAWSGAAAISWQGNDDSDNPSVAVSGAVGVNLIDSTTRVLIEDATIENAKTLNAWALSGGQQIAAALGLQISKSSGDSTGVTVGAAVSVNDIDKIVEARLANNIVTGRDDEGQGTVLDVTAYASDVQVTGGVQLAGGNQKAQIGATVGVATIHNQVNAEISGGTYTHMNGVGVNALLGTTQVNAAVAGGVATDSSSVSLNGAVLYNSVTNDVTSKIGDGVSITGKNATVSALARDFRVGDSAFSIYQNNLTQNNADYANSRGVTQDGSEFYQANAGSGLDGIDTTIDTAMVDGKTDSATVDLSQEGEGSLIVTAALAVSGSSGNGAAGAAVAIDQVNNTFTAEIENANLNVREVTTTAKSDTRLIGVAAGAAVSKGGFAGMGSVSWQEINNTVNSGIRGNTEITASNGVTIQALNEAEIVNVAGQLTYGGKAGVGAALGYNEINNNAHAYIKDGSAGIRGDQVIVSAENNSYILDIVAAGSAAQNVAIGGAVAINSIGNQTTAIIDGAEIANANQVNATATDESKIDTIVGALTGAGKVAVGGAVGYNEVGTTTPQRVEAAIRNTTISGADSIAVTAINDARIRVISAAAGGAENTSIQGAGAANIIRKETIAEMSSVVIDEGVLDGVADVKVISNSAGEIDSIAVVVGGSGTAAVGAGVAVNDITENTTAKVSGGQQNVQNLLVKGNAGATIKTIGVAGNGAGTVGVAGSVAVNLIENNNKAVIDNGAVIIADGSIGVIAETDNFIANYAGVLAFGGTAGVGVATSVNEISGDTIASIEGADTEVTAGGEGSGHQVRSDIADSEIFDSVVEGDTLSIANSLKNNRIDEMKTGVIVDASTTNTMKSFLGNASGGGTVAANGTVNVNLINGSTKAQINEATINQSTKKSNVSVRSADYTNSSGLVGTASIAGTASVAASADTAVISRSSEAIVGNENTRTTIYADTLTVEADAKQGISSLGAGVSVGATGGGVAGTASVVTLDGITRAAMYGVDAEVNSLDVRANHLTRIHQAVGSVGGGFYAGIGAAVGVVLDESTTEALVEGSMIAVKNDGDVTIDAANKTEIKTIAASAGVGAAGVSGAIQVNNMKSNVRAALHDSTIGSDSERAATVTVASSNDNTLTTYLGNVAGGIAGVGASVTVNTVDNQVQTQVMNSKIYSSQDIKISAEETRNFEQVAMNGAIGAAAIGANVMVTAVGTSVENEKVNDNDTININNSFTSVNKAVSGNQLDSQNSLNGALDAEKAATLNQKTSVTASKGGNGQSSSVGVEVSNSVMDASGNIAISATEETNTDMFNAGLAGGAVAGSAGVGILDVNRNVSINIEKSMLKGQTGVDISTAILGENKVNITNGTIGGVAINAAYGRVDVDGKTTIHVAESTIESDNDVKTSATDTSKIAIDIKGATAGGAALSALIAQGTNKSQNQIYFVDSTLTGKNITLEARRENGIDTKVTSGSIGFVSAVGVGATAENQGKNIISIVNSDVTATEDILLQSASNNTVKADATGGSIGGVSLSGVTATAADQSESKIDIEKGSNLAGKNITATTETRGAITADVRAGSAGVISGSGAIATATNSAKGTVKISESDIIGTNAVNLKSLINNSITANAQGGSGGLASVAAVSATAKNESQGTVEIIKDSEVEGTTVTATAEIGGAITANVSAGSVGAISGSGASATATNSAKGTVRISESNIIGTNAINLKSLINNSITANAQGGSGGLASVAAVSATAKNESQGTVEIIKDSEVKGTTVTAITETGGAITADVKAGAAGAISGAGAVANATNSVKGTVRVSESSVTGTNQVNLRSWNHNTVTANADAASYGAVAVGVVEGRASNNSHTIIDIQDNNTFGGQDLYATAENANVVRVNTIAAAAALEAGVSNRAIASDSSTAEVKVGKGNLFATERKIDLKALNTPIVNADLSSVVGATVAVGRSDTRANANAKALVNIGSGNQFDAGAVDFSSHITSRINVNGLATAGGLAGVAASSAHTASETTSSVIVGENNQYSDETDLTVKAESDTVQTSRSKQRSGGFVAVGDVEVSATSKNTTEVIINGSTGDSSSQLRSLTVFATGKTTNDVVADATSGGFVGATNVSGKSVIEAQTDVTVAGNWNIKGTAKINANQINKANLKVTTGSGGFVGNATASIDNEIESQTKIIIKEGTFQAGTLSVEATDTIGDGLVELKTEGSGFVGLSESASANRLNSTATIDVKNANIYTRGDQKYLAKNVVGGFEYNVVANGGGFAGKADTYNNSKMTFNSSFNLDKDSRLETSRGGDIDIRVTDDLAIELDSIATAKGFGSGAYAHINIELNRDKKIDIAGDIYSSGDVSLTADERKNIELYLKATAKGLIAIDKEYVRISGTQKHTINIHKDSVVESKGDIEITALAPKLEMRAQGSIDYHDTDDMEHARDEDGKLMYEDDYEKPIKGTNPVRYEQKPTMRPIKKTAPINNLDGYWAALEEVFGFTRPSGGEGKVNVDGQLIAGARSQYDIVIGNPGDKQLIDASNPNMLDVTVNGEKRYGDLDNITVEYDAAGNPVAVNVAEIVAQGGNIRIYTTKKDDLSGTGSMTANQAAGINITNNSNLALNTQGLQIAQGNTGITLNGSADNITKNYHNGIAVHEKAGGSGNIHVISNWNSLVNGINPNTDINIGGLVSTPGSVNILSKQGDINTRGISAGNELILMAERGNINVQAGSGEFATSNLGDNKVIVVASKNVNIQADKISANGLIQSGIADFVTELNDPAMSSKITSLVGDKDLGLTDEEVMRNDKYKLNDGGFKQVDGYYRFEPQAYYNPTTGEIIFENIVSDGGHIALSQDNLVGKGTILALDGVAHVNLSVKDDAPVRLGKIETTKKVGKIVLGANEYYNENAPHDHNGATVDYIGYNDGDIQIDAAGDIYLTNLIENDKKEKTNQSVVSITSGGKITQQISPLADSSIISDHLILSSVTGQELTSEGNQVNELMTQNTGTGDIIFNNSGTEGLKVTFTHDYLDGELAIVNKTDALELTNGITAKSNILLTNNEDNGEDSGDIIIGGDLAAIEGQIVIAALNAGDILIDGTLSAKNDVLVASGDGNINAQDVTSDEGSITITTDAGGILSAGTLSAKNNVLVASGGGNINAQDVTSDEGSITITTDAGDILSAGTLSAKNNVLVASGDGNINAQDVTSDEGSITITTDAGDILSDGTLSAKNNVLVASGGGNISTQDVTSGERNIVITTEAGNILSEGTLSAKHNVLVASGGGNISTQDVTSGERNIVIITDVGNILSEGTLWAKGSDGEIIITTNNGDVTVQKSDSKQLLVEVKDGDNLIRFGEIIVGDLIQMRGNDIKSDYVGQRAGHNNEVTFSLRGIDSNQPMNRVDFPMINVQNGVWVDDLWSVWANMHVEGSVFRVDDLKITDHAFFSNNETKVKVLGRPYDIDPTQDVQIWNEAAPDEARIFLHFPMITTNGKLLDNDPYTKVFNRRRSATSESSLLNRYANARAAHWWRFGDLDEYYLYLDNRLTKNVIWAEENPVNSEQSDLFSMKTH